MDRKLRVHLRSWLVLGLAMAFAACTEDDTRAEPGSLEALREASMVPIVARNDEVTGTIRTLMGRVPTTGATAEERARGFLDAYGGLFGVADPRADLQVRHARAVATGSTVVVLDRQVGGVPILGAAIRVRVDSGGNVAYVATADPGPAEGSATPGLTEDEAVEAAVRAAELSAAPAETSTPALLRVSTALLLDDEETPSSRLAWVTDLVASEADDFAELRVAVDAETGAALGWWPTEEEALPRRTFTAAGSRDRAAAIRAAVQWMDDTGAVAGQTPDADARAAHDNAGVAQAYFQGTHDVDVYSELVTHLDQYVHFVYSRRGRIVLNASYSSRYESLWYSDGMASLDVVTHELTHGVTGFFIGLAGVAVPGAIGESLSDVFAAFVDTATQWTIGDGSTRGVLRDLQDPTRFRQPRHYDDRRLVRGGLCDVDTPCPAESACLNGRCYEIKTDAGFKHSNSGITNHAAYLLVAGGQGNGRTSEVRVRGIRQARAEQIYGCALTGLRLGETPRFGDLRDALLDCCLDLVENPRAEREAIERRDCGAVLNAFAAVGIGKPDRDEDAFDDDIDNCPDWYNPDRQGPGVECESEEPPTGPQRLDVCSWRNFDGTTGGASTAGDATIQLSGDLVAPTITIRDPGLADPGLVSVDFGIEGGGPCCYSITSCLAGRGCDPGEPAACSEYGPSLPLALEYGDYSIPGARHCTTLRGVPAIAPPLESGRYYSIRVEGQLADRYDYATLSFVLDRDLTTCP